MILHTLSKKKLFYGQLKRVIPNVSQKVLTQQLRQLETDGVVARVTFPGKVVKVQYSLTELGQQLVPVLEKLHQFSAKI